MKQRDILLVGHQIFGTEFQMFCHCVRAELALHDYVNLAECQQMLAGVSVAAPLPNERVAAPTPNERVATPPGTQFPNVIGYASTQHILALYGNPRTPLLPHQPGTNSTW